MYVILWSLVVTVLKEVLTWPSYIALFMILLSVICLLYSLFKQGSITFPKYTSSVAQRNLKNFSQVMLKLGCSHKRLFGTMMHNVIWMGWIFYSPFSLFYSFMDSPTLTWQLVMALGKYQNWRNASRPTGRSLKQWVFVKCSYDSISVTILTWKPDIHALNKQESY